MAPTNKIPILDCSLISGPYQGLEGRNGFESFMKQLGDGMRQVGFVYLVNNGVHSSKVEAALAESRAFFALPKEKKMKYRKVDAVENFHGYTPPEDEKVDEISKSTPDYKEAWDCWGSEMLDEGKYPSEIPGFKGAMDDFRTSMNELSKKILLCFGRYLKLDDPEFFIKRHCALEDLRIPSHNVVRSNYYMALDSVGKDELRLGEHNDWGTMTFLFQDSTGGLEAKIANGGWVPVPPIKDSIVFNAGLMLEMWSGGLFPATAHRVRLLESKVPRQSIGYFIQPDGSSNCVPLVKEKEDWAPLYPKVDKGTSHYEYFKNRVRGSRAY